MKRLITVLLTVVIIISLFTGCTVKQQSKSDSEKQTLSDSKTENDDNSIHTLYFKTDEKAKRR